VKKWRLVLQNEFTYGELGSMVSPALKRARKEGVVGDTAVLSEFSRPSVLLCYYINPEKEIDLKYCEQKGITIHRILSSGGTGVSNTGQMVLSLYFDAPQYPLPPDAQGIMRVILSGLAEAFSTHFDVDCRFRPLNDLVIGPRKFTLCTCYLDGPIAQFRLAVQVKRFSLDVNRIITPPPEKFADKQGKSVSEVITSIEEAAGRPPSFPEVRDVMLGSLTRTLGVQFQEGDLTPREADYIARSKEAYDNPSFKFARTERMKFGAVPAGAVRSEYREKITRGPMISIVVLTREGRIQNILINGGFQVSPLEMVERLEDALLDTEVREDSIRKKVEEVYSMPHVEFPGLAAEEFSRIIFKAASGGGKEGV